MHHMTTEQMKAQAQRVWEETLRLHARCQETRVASSISCIEILVALFYGGTFRYDPKEPLAEGRDRLVISKGHGSISFYPILADLGFIDPAELLRPGRPGALLKAIPDPHIPGYETVNGSLGHGIGVGAGMALGLRAKGSDSRVVVLCGDGELHEGAMWEGVMLAARHGLANLTLIVDNNRQCMLDYSQDVLGLAPLADKFRAFGWDAVELDGHDVGAVHAALDQALTRTTGKPLVIVAETIKGRGVKGLEGEPLCHIFNVKPERVDAILGEELS
jgi:transketolase